VKTNQAEIRAVEMNGHYQAAQELGHFGKREIEFLRSELFEIGRVTIRCKDCDANLKLRKARRENGAQWVLDGPTGFTTNTALTESCADRRKRKDRMIAELANGLSAEWPLF
jgi:hypothetical protein